MLVSISIKIKFVSTLNEIRNITFYRMYVNEENEKLVINDKGVLSYHVMSCPIKSNLTRWDIEMMIHSNQFGKNQDSY